MWNPFRRKTKRQKVIEQAQAVFDPLTLLAAQEAYRWARIDRRTEGYQPQARSGDAAIFESSDMMTRRIRDQVRNNAQVKRIVQALTDLVVGCGVQTFAWPFLPWETLEVVKELEAATSGTLNPRLRYALESDDLFEEWWNDPQQIDIEGKRSGPELQRALIREAIQVGNGFLIRVTPKGTLVPLAYQLIEREQLDTSKDRPRSEGQNKIVNGVEMARSGRIVAYHFLGEHPHDSYSGGTDTDSQRVAADRVIDLCLWDRPSAGIGATWLDAVAQTSFDRDSFLDAEIKTAAKGALLALIHKSENPHLAQTLGLLDDDDDSDEYGNEEVKMGTSPMAARVGVNESVEMVESNRPTNTANNFLKICDRDTAVGAGISYYTETGDYESTNYSSVRAAKLDEDMHIRTLQQWFGLRVALPIRREFNRRAAASGLLETVRPAEFRRNNRRYQRFDAIGPGRDHLDPYKETEAAIARLRAGLSTLKYECARRGQHWIKVLMQQGLEGAIAELFNATIDWSKGGGVAETEVQQRKTAGEPVEQGADQDAQ